MRKNVLDFNSLTSVEGIIGTGKYLIGSAVDGVTSLRGKSVSPAHVPSKTPGPLVTYREAELQSLRGNGTGERKE
ncbi:hypothetical protein JHK82_017177 [Glycine max]|nr:hypothetical protein JHK85_017617 [Glycine max]KAG5036391.1 hypothetical protein JHK86_017231 [Glycine max]KAG5141482.1 hypothetical protein JHK82_017177 [Glycine max]